MNPYRSTPTDDDEIIFKPRSRWPAFVALVAMWGFVAFVDYGFLSAFGREGLIIVPASVLLAVLMTVRICWTAQNMQYFRASETRGAGSQVSSTPSARTS